MTVPETVGCTIVTIDLTVYGKLVQPVNVAFVSEMKPFVHVVITKMK